MGLEIPKDVPIFESSSESNNESQTDNDRQSDSADDDASSKKKDSSPAKSSRKKTDASDPPKKSRSGKRRNPEDIGVIDTADLLRLDLGDVSDARVRAFKREGKYYIHKGDVSALLGLDEKARKSVHMPGEVKGKIGGSGSGAVFLPFEELINTTSQKITGRPSYSYFLSHRENFKKTGGTECFVACEDIQPKKKSSSKEKAEKPEGAQSQSNGKPAAKKDPPEKKKVERKKPAADNTRSALPDFELTKLSIRLKRLSEDLDDIVGKRILLEEE